MTGTLQDIQVLASTQVGVIETGGPHGNDGNVVKYNEWYGGSGFQGNPWCATFISWVFFMGGCPLPASTSIGFAYTPSGASWFQKNNRWSQTPKVGYVVFFSMGGKRIDHVGLVTAINPDGSIQTIEGNTSAGTAGSQRDGGGVYRRTRKSNIVGYGMPIYSEGPPPVPPVPGKKASVEFFGYDASVVGGVRVAIGDVNGDGKDELITVPGPGYPAHVRIWDISGASPVELAGFYAFDSNINTGFYVAVDDNGRLIVTADHGGGPHIKAYTWADITG